MASALTEQQSDSLQQEFLTLPAEIRNIIYRYVLHEDYIYAFDGTLPPSQPGLLQVNRQLRKEASEIYYKENIFRFEIRGFNIDTLLEWSRSSPHRQHATLGLRFDRTILWKNLLKWLKAYYDIELRDMGHFTDYLHNSIRAAARMFEVVQKSGDKGLSWEEVEVNLEMWHKVLAAENPKWQ
jgi:hypothetical protein